MGKYTKWRDKLPAFENPDSAWRTQVDELRQKIADNLNGGNPPTLAQLGHEFRRKKKAKDRLEDQLKAMNATLEALSSLLVDALEDSEFEKVELAHGGSITLRDEPYPKVADRDKILAWIAETGQQELLSVHHQTLKGLVSELLVSGKPLPPGVEVFIKTSARLYE